MMEAKHIVAVKKPYRRSSKNQALGQIILTNQRLDKLAALRVELSARGMLSGPCPRLPRFLRRRNRALDSSDLELEVDSPKDSDSEESSGDPTPDSSDSESDGDRGREVRRRTRTSLLRTGMQRSLPVFF